MLKLDIPLKLSNFPSPIPKDSTLWDSFTSPGSAQLPLDSKRSLTLKKKRDNPHSDRFIEVGTKALRRETDVWGDAAGTAPAVTSVTSLAPSIYFQSTVNGRAIEARLFFAFGADWLADLYQSCKAFANSKF